MWKRRHKDMSCVPTSKYLLCRGPGLYGSKLSSLQPHGYTADGRQSCAPPRGLPSGVSLISEIQTSHRDCFCGLILSTWLYGQQTQKEKKTQFLSQRRQHLGRGVGSKRWGVSVMECVLGPDGPRPPGESTRLLALPVSENGCRFCCWFGRHRWDTATWDRNGTGLHAQGEAFLVITEATTYSVFSTKCCMLASFFMFLAWVCGKM